MFLLENVLKKRDELAGLAMTLEKKLRNSPKGNLCISKSHKSIQYHLAEEGNPHKKMYLNKKKLSTAISLAQRDYNKNLLAEIKKNILTMNTFIKTYTPQKLINCYTNLPQGRKKLVTPFFISDEEYAQNWQKKEYEHKKEAPEGNLLSFKNEPMRSKSEVIIANLLKEKNIPYHYEYPVHMKNGATFHVDFLCLNTRTRQEFYWEHCGRMDDPDYTSSMTRRISEYSRTGIILGKNLIITMETEQSPLDIKEVERTIKTFLF